MLQIDRIHHVAYRCKDAKQTVLWYGKMLNMDFVLAIAEDQVPSTKAPDPYMHVFLDAGGGNVLAFFELPTQAADGPRPEHARLGAAHRLQGQGPGRRCSSTRRTSKPRASRCWASPTTAPSTRSTSSTPTATASNWPARTPTRRPSTPGSTR